MGSGVSESINCPLLAAAATDPNRPAIIESDRQLTYGQLNAAVDTAVARLQDKGIVTGDVIALLGRNSIESALIFFAAFRLGFTLMPLNFRLESSAWIEQTKKAGAKLVLLDHEFENTVDFPAEEVPLSSLTDKRQSNNPQSGAGEFELDREALIIFSSGSTGKPQGIVLSWRNLYFSALGAAEKPPLKPDDCWLAVLPFFHVGGISILFRSVLAGSRALVTSEFNPGQVLKLVESKKITHLSVVPTMLDELLLLDHENYLAGLKAIILGGARIESSLITEFSRRNLPVLTTYGMTETASMISLLPPDAKQPRFETAGQVLPYREIKIEDQRVLVRGEVLFSRYLDTTETGAEDGWFATGDLGSIDSEGYLIIRGRRDDMIISGGENIDPRRIEQAMRAIPGIDRAVVMSRPDRKWGQRPVAFVTVTDSNLTEKAIAKTLRDELGAVIAPDRVLIIPEIPLTGSGKIDRSELQLRLIEIFDNGD